MFKLTDSLPYMLHMVAACLEEAFSSELADHQLTIPMYRVLAALLEREDQRLGELGEMTGIESSTLSRLIGTMKGRRLVSRRRQKNDERSLHIGLTPEGRILIERLVPRAVYYENLAVRNFDTASIDVLKDALHRMQENVAGLKAFAQNRPPMDVTRKRLIEKKITATK